MKSFTSAWVFKDVVEGLGWTDQPSEKISKEHFNVNNTSKALELKIIK